MDADLQDPVKIIGLRKPHYNNKGFNILYRIIKHEQ